MGIHSYLTYLRDRLLLTHSLLHESGSCMVQISDENLHHVRELMDEVFGAKNAVVTIVVRKTAAVSSPMARTNALPTTCDYIVWYAKDAAVIKYRQLYAQKGAGDSGAGVYARVELVDGTRRRMTTEEMRNPATVPAGSRIYRLDNLTSSGWSETLSMPIEYGGTKFTLPGNLHWKTTPDGMKNLIGHRRAVPSGNSLAYVRFFDDFPVSPVSDVWLDTGSGSFTDPKVFVVQTNTKVMERCILMTTDPGEIVLDITCGSGTTAYVAEDIGRRWITCDTSRVAVALAKQRLMTAIYDYYRLAQPTEGVGSGFVYKNVPHVTLKSIANNEPPGQETLYDQPEVDKTRIRVSGPFTVEAVPAPAVRPISEMVIEERPAVLDEQPSLPGIGPLDGQTRLELREEVAVARYGETARQRAWRDELAKCGIRGRGG
ncbi:MAG TPA: site-specific DNA-methyltransferase, partial [Pirellulales bacterium]|nr:site-specific DNA-methyltransferase [Pirellulales bacterium]